MLGNQPDVDPAAEVAGSAVLIDAGQHALALSGLVNGARQLWLRNGLGQTTRAEVERTDERVGLTLLRLPVALDPGSSNGPLALAARDPFPGSPGYAVDFLADKSATPAWPWLHIGFLGSPQGNDGTRRLGIALPAGEPRGGPVFDAEGRLAGIAISDNRWLPASQLRSMLNDESAALSAMPRLQPDEIYERSLGVTLQLITKR